jgi:hypothetical protein
MTDDPTPELRLHLPEGAAPRRGEPITCGVPWPRGLLHDAEQLELLDEEGRRLALQSRALDRWSDGSVRWSLLDWRAEASPDRPRYRLRAASGRASRVAPEARVEGRASDAERMSVSTGPLVLELATGDGLLVRRAHSNAADPLLEAGSLALEAEDERGARYRARVERLELTENGPLRVSLRAWGGLLGERERRLAEVILRLELFAGSPVLRMELTVRNTRPAGHPGGIWSLGSAGSIYFRELYVRVAPRVPLDGVAAACSERLGLPLAPIALPMELYQDSSGGERWDSSNHRGRGGELPVRFRGYRLRAAEMESLGLRAAPIVRLESGGRELSATMRHFWQNFPKAIAASTDGISLQLFPRQHAALHELQGGEQKTHVWALALGRDPVSDPPLDWCRAPAVAVVSPEWHARCQSVAHLAPESADPGRVYAEMVRAAIAGEDSFEAKRERIDEYGWRHFGELWADHEAVNQKEPPLCSHYNNQYDAIYGFAVQLLRSGDPRWFVALDELARHVIDIDLYHTDGDKSAYNHGMFWHTVHYTDAGLSTHRSYPEGSAGGGPSGGHLYTSGLMLYHFLVGNPMAREVVIGLGRYVIDADDGALTVLRYLDRGETGHISGSGSDVFHGAGRSPANSLVALLDALRLSGDRRFLVKAERLLQRTVHPDDDLAALNLGDVERRWYYTMFLQSLGRYLDLKQERNELDGAWAYARRALLHYAAWAAENERPYLDRPEILEFPTETWAAQDMRKSELLQIAALHAGETQRGRFLERARAFHDYSLEELARRPTRTLCRPLVLLLSNGYSRSFFERPLPAPAAVPDRPAGGLRGPTRFVPQKVRAKRRLLRALVLGGLAFALLAVAAATRW